MSSNLLNEAIKLKFQLQNKFSNIFPRRETWCNNFDELAGGVPNGPKIDVSPGREIIGASGVLPGVLSKTGRLDDIGVFLQY